MWNTCIFWPVNDAFFLEPFRSFISCSLMVVRDGVSQRYRQVVLAGYAIQQRSVSGVGVFACFIPYDNTVVPGFHQSENFPTNLLIHKDMSPRVFWSTSIGQFFCMNVRLSGRRSYCGELTLNSRQCCGFGSTCFWSLISTVLWLASFFKNKSTLKN